MPRVGLRPLPTPEGRPPLCSAAVCFFQFNKDLLLGLV